MSPMGSRRGLHDSKVGISARIVTVDTIGMRGREMVSTRYPRQLCACLSDQDRWHSRSQVEDAGKGPGVSVGSQDVKRIETGRGVVPKDF